MVWNRVVLYSVIIEYMDNIYALHKLCENFEDFLRNVFCQMLSKNIQ